MFTQLMCTKKPRKRCCQINSIFVTATVSIKEAAKAFNLAINKCIHYTIRNLGLFRCYFYQPNAKSSVASNGSDSLLFPLALRWSPGNMDMLIWLDNQESLPKSLCEIRIHNLQIQAIAIAISIAQICSHYVSKLWGHSSIVKKIFGISQSNGHLLGFCIGLTQLAFALRIYPMHLLAKFFIIGKFFPSQFSKYFSTFLGFLPMIMSKSHMRMARNDRQATTAFTQFHSCSHIAIIAQGEG